MIRKYSDLQRNALNSDFDTPEFKSWFSGSKVVEENGNPKILYHGGTKWDAVGEGRPWTSFWATDDPFVADTYAGRYSKERSEIKPVVLCLKNPIDLRDPETAKDFLGYDISKGDFNRVEKNMALNIGKESQKMVSDAKSLGFDGIIHFDTDQYNRGCHTSYVAFYPEQVRIVEDVDFGETETRFRKKAIQEKEVPVVVLSSPEKDISVPDVIRNLLKRSRLTPRQINFGNCDIFASDLWELIGGEVLEIPFGHLWVKHGGKHYDAETPEGVFDYQELPFFKREKK